jgi:hypothetical protein
MLHQSDELVAEYVYNGLGHRIGVHYDVDEDGDVDGDDPRFWFAYDERWRIVATFRDDDPPKIRRKCSSITLRYAVWQRV